MSKLRALIEGLNERREFPIGTRTTRSDGTWVKTRSGWMRLKQGGGTSKHVKPPKEKTWDKVKFWADILTSRY